MPSISEVVDVTITVQSSSVTRVGFDSILINGDESNFNPGFAEFAVEKYTSLADLTDNVDIKPGSEVELLATSIFAQIPAVPTVYVTRTNEGEPAVQESTLLYQILPLTAANTVAVSIDGSDIAGSPVPFDVGGSDDTMDAIATAIQAEAGVATAVATAFGQVEKNLITITGAVAGASFQVTSDVLTGVVVDEHIDQVITDPAVDLLPSSAINSIIANDNTWFGYVHTFISPTDAETAAAALAANRKFGMFKFSAASTIPNLGTNFSATWINQSADPVRKYVDGAALSAMLARPVGSYNPAYLSLELTDASDLSSSDEALLRTGFANQYTEIGGQDVTYDGHAGNGGWIDTYINVLWLQARIEEDVFALMAAVDKVPFTDSGIAQITSALSGRLQNAEDLGVITANPKFVITAPLASEVNPVDKSNRLLAGVTFTAFTAGAVNLVQINGVLVD